MIKFENFDYIEVLSLKYNDAPSYSTSEIFANGNNQVPITVSVLLRDKKGEIISLTENDLKDLIYFANPITGEDISTSSNRFQVSDIKGEFADSAVYSRATLNQEKNSKEVHIKKYLSSTTSFTHTEFCVGINIPGYGKFDTSNKGTGNKLPSGSEFVSPQSLSLIAREAIDYSDNKNLLIEDNDINLNDFYKIVTDMRVKVAGSSGGWTGVSSYRCVKIRLKDDFKIAKKEIIRNKAKVKDMLNIYGFTGTDSKGESLFNENGSADIILGRRPQYDPYSFDTSLVFIDQKKFGIRNTLRDPLVNQENGIRLFNNSSKDVWYTIGSKDERHVLTAGEGLVPSLSDKYILIVTTNHAVINIKHLSQRRWENTPTNLTSLVKIYDEFGNYGEIKIGLPENKWPNIAVNNQ